MKQKEYAFETKLSVLMSYVQFTKRFSQQTKDGYTALRRIGKLIGVTANDIEEINTKFKLDIESEYVNKKYCKAVFMVMRQHQHETCQFHFGLN